MWIAVAWVPASLPQTLWLPDILTEIQSVSRRLTVPQPEFFPSRVHKYLWKLLPEMKLIIFITYATKNPSRCVRCESLLDDNFQLNLSRYHSREDRFYFAFTFFSLLLSPMGDDCSWSSINIRMSISRLIFNCNILIPIVCIIFISRR